jgi:hypothetical protein
MKRSISIFSVIAVTIAAFVSSCEDKDREQDTKNTTVAVLGVELDQNLRALDIDGSFV